MEESVKYTRRRFLGILGATAAGTGLSGDVLAQVRSLLDRRDEWYDRTEERIPSICKLCPGGCGLSVRVVGGLPVKIDGNPLYPVNHGALCPRGLAGLQSLYDPDRLVSPLRRVGPKGSGQWEQISWDEAVQAVAGSLADLRKRGSPEGLVILGGEYRGAIDRLWARFAEAYGTPNYVRLRTFKPEVPDPVAVLMHGEVFPISFDLRDAAFVLSFGCNWVESWNSPVYQMQAYGYMRQGRRGRRAQIVHVEPRLSYSAAKADLWVPIEPGTEGVFALGLAHLILREQIYDEDFVRNNTFGFEDWQGADGQQHTGFKRLVLDEYTLVRVSEITGVRPETIVTVARKFASSRPAIALGDNRSLLEGHDLFTRMAIHSLNALVGSIGVAGGVLPGREAPPQTPWPAVTRDETAERGLARGRLDDAGVAERFLDSDVPRGLAGAVLRAESSPVEVLIIHRANPIYGRPDKDQFRKALQNIPLVVSLSGVPDEVSEYADLILPEHHFLEGWQDDVVTHLPGFTLFGIGRPATRPLYDTRHAGDLILGLGKGVGGSMAKDFPWKSYEELLRTSAKGLFEAGRGYIVSTPTDELLRQILQRQGYRAPESDSFEKFWQALAANGAWWDPMDPVESTRRRFQTPSGKFEFYSQILEARLQEAASAGIGAGRTASDERRRILSALGVVVQEEELVFPRVLLSLRDDADADFPFLLQTYELLSVGGGIGANFPWLQEHLAAHVSASWESSLEIHPEVAQEMGIRDGDWVWVESAHGRLRVRARLYPGTRPDVVSLPVGQGHMASGRWAQDRGVDPSDIVVSTTDPGEGLGIRRRTRVRIRPA